MVKKKPRTLKCPLCVRPIPALSVVRVEHGELMHLACIIRAKTTSPPPSDPRPRRAS